jgi:hypothetical protein
MTPMPVTFNVKETAPASLAQRKPGDPVKGPYVGMGDQRIIKSVVKG